MNKRSYLLRTMTSDLTHQNGEKLKIVTIQVVEHDADTSKDDASGSSTYVIASVSADDDTAVKDVAVKTWPTLAVHGLPCLHFHGELVSNNITKLPSPSEIKADDIATYINPALQHLNAPKFKTDFELRDTLIKRVRSLIECRTGERIELNTVNKTKEAKRVTTPQTTNSKYFGVW